MSYVFLAFFLLLLKSGMVAGLARWAPPLLRGNILAALLTGWLGVQSLQLLGMAGLSLWHQLTPTGYAIWVGIQVIFILAALATGPKDALPFRTSYIRSFPTQWVMIALLLLITATLFFRAVFFFDTSFDSYCYGLPRLAYFFQHRSIFAHQQGMILKMFCNEWNGELNALHYGLLTGGDRAFALSGVEVWWVSFLAVVMFARAIGFPIFGAAWTGLIIVSTPSIFNLAGVTKGDVLAMASVTCALAHLFRMKATSFRDPYFAMAFLWLAFGAGSKATVVPILAVFVAISGVWMLWSNRSRVGSVCYAAPLPMTVIGSMGLLFCLRYVANSFVFHNPLQRNPFEYNQKFTWVNVPVAWEVQARHFFSLDNDLTLVPSFASAMVRGFGVTGWLVFGVVISFFGWRILAAIQERFFFSTGKSLPCPTSWIAHSQTTSWFPTIFIGGMFLVWLYLTGLFPFKEIECRLHRLRFFMPFLVPVSVIAFSFLAQTSIGRRPGMWLVIGVIAVTANLFFGFRPSEIMVTKGLRRLPIIARNYDHFTSKLMDEYSNTYRTSLGHLAEKKGLNQRVLIVMRAEMSPIFQFFGNDLEWICEVIDSPEGLRKRLSETPFDWVVVTKGDPQLFDDSCKVLTGMNCSMDFDGRNQKLFRGPSSIEKHVSKANTNQ